MSPHVNPRERRGMAPFGAGLLAVVFIALVAYFAYTKDNPFATPYRFTAIFDHANELKQRSPVRIAGVNVGKVVEVEAVESGSGLARVKMELSEDGLPIKKDAELRVRQRIFLEGNYFVDLEPGSPSAPELPDGGIIPPNQTAAPVQFGQVLTALQRDTREDLQVFLREFSKATQGSGAAGFNRAIRYWERAYRDTSQVSDATLGTEQHDLNRVLRGQGRVFGALSKDEEALKDLVTHLNITVAAFARQEDNLKATIPALRDVLRVGRPALRSLNTALPSLRAFARDATPAARSTSQALDAQLPFIKQARRLVSPAELGGLSGDLRSTVPFLVRLNQGSARTLAQSRGLSACQNNVLLPFAKEPIPDDDFPLNTNQPWYKQAQRAFVGLAGESRLSDANSSFFRIQGGGGATTIVSTGETGEKYIAQPLLPIEGVRPARPSQRPVNRPGVPCETQQPPNLKAALGPGEQAAKLNPVLNAKNRARMAREQADFKKVGRHLERVARGEPSVDPLSYTDRGERLAWRKLRAQQKAAKR